MVEFDPDSPVDRALAKKIRSTNLSDSEKKKLSAEFKKSNPNMGLIDRILGKKK